jgi:ribosomal protein S18 acetylase RimI-like enzyme
MLTIRLVRPGEDMAVVVDFYLQQSQSYAAFSAERAVYSPTQDEVADGSVYYIVAHDCDTGDLCGGLRIHLRSSGAQLPVERALANDSKVHRVLMSHVPNGLAEMSGLWVKVNLRGTGLSSHLMRTGIAAMPLLGVHKVLAFTHQHVLDFWTPLGFYFDPRLDRTYSYPDARYKSRIIWIDPDDLSSAESGERATIRELRSCLDQGRAIYWPRERVRDHVASARQFG